MGRPFTQSVELEKKHWIPLPEDASASSKLRRRFFQGQWLNPDDAAALGQTPGLLGAMMKLMGEWGFTFESRMGTNNKVEFRLTNPTHVPVAVERRSRRGTKRRNGTPDHERIRDKLLSGDPITCAESMAMGASSSFLRREVVRLEEEGYKFEIDGHGRERTYQVIRAPKGHPQPETTAIEKSPIAQVPIASKGQSVASELLFGELAVTPPKLGSQIRVVGLMLEENGEEETLLLALKNGSGTWTASVEGYAEAESSG